MVLLSGSAGIGSGWSTTIPNTIPLDKAKPKAGIKVQGW
jgi:hypothetical protein